MGPNVTDDDGQTDETLEYKRDRRLKTKRLEREEKTDRSSVCI